MNPHAEACETCGQEGGGHTRWHWKEMQAAQNAQERTPASHGTKKTHADFIECHCGKLFVNKVDMGQHLHETYGEPPF